MKTGEHDDLLHLERCKLRPNGLVYKYGESRLVEAGL
jgi:hypothetical protein